MGLGHLVQCYSHTYSFSYNEHWYKFDLKKRGYTHKNLVLNFVSYIHLFDPCMLLRWKKDTFTLKYIVGEKA